MLTINNRLVNTRPNHPLATKSYQRVITPEVNGLVPYHININGLDRPPVASGCVLYLPFWHPALGGSTLKSLDQYAHTATVSGALWTPQGRTFDGIDDDISIPNTNLKTLTAGTILIWYKMLATGASDDIFDSSSYGLTENADYLAISLSAANALLLDIQTGNVPRLLATGATFSINTWYQIGFSVDASGNLLYLNGVASTPTYTTGSATTAYFLNDLPTDQEIYIKRLKYNGTYYSRGNANIGEASVYSRALTDAEIQQNYLATKFRYQ